MRSGLWEVAFLAGAAGVIAGLWALPADPQCTGRITADCLAAVGAGVGPAEALRLARASFLAERDTTVRVPGQGGARMDKAAPWAWAGLCAFG